MPAAKWKQRREGEEGGVSVAREKDWAKLQPQLSTAGERLAEPLSPTVQLWHSTERQTLQRHCGHICRFSVQRQFVISRRHGPTFHRRRRYKLPTPASRSDRPHSTASGHHKG